MCERFPEKYSSEIRCGKIVGIVFVESRVGRRRPETNDRHEGFLALHSEIEIFCMQLPIWIWYTFKLSDDMISSGMILKITQASWENYVIFQLWFLGQVRLFHHVESVNGFSLKFWCFILILNRNLSTVCFSHPLEKVRWDARMKNLLKQNKQKSNCKFVWKG